jgi:N-acetylglucosaminyl-diphospho-decaprenol L-rhamnosyltransferase
MPPGSVIIVTYNSAECIEHCLTAVMRAEGWELVVVDNASTDTTRDIVRWIAPNSCILPNSQNMGFATAVNQGVKAAKGEILVILNPDTIPTPGSLDLLAQTLSEDNIGAAGGMLAAREGEPQKGFTLRRLPTLASVLAEVLILNRLVPTNPWNRQYRCLDVDYSQEQDVDQPAGACLAIKRRAWEELNGFDESFFPVWFEDVDFCRRLRGRGWMIHYCPQARFIHTGGHSVNKLNFGNRQSYWYRNLLRYFAKHHTKAAVACLRLGIVAGMALRSLLVLLGVRPGGVPVKEALGAYWRVLWDYGVLGRALQTSADERALAPLVV